MGNIIRVSIILEFPMKESFDMDAAFDEMHYRVINDLSFEPESLHAINIEVVDEDDMVIDILENLYV